MDFFWYTKVSKSLCRNITKPIFWSPASGCTGRTPRRIAPRKERGLSCTARSVRIALQIFARLPGTRQLRKHIFKNRAISCNFQTTSSEGRHLSCRLIAGPTWTCAVRIRHSGDAPLTNMSATVCSCPLCLPAELHSTWSSRLSSPKMMNHRFIDWLR